MKGKLNLVSWVEFQCDSYPFNNHTDHKTSTTKDKLQWIYFISAENDGLSFTAFVWAFIRSAMKQLWVTEVIFQIRHSLGMYIIF